MNSCRAKSKNATMPHTIIRNSVRRIIAVLGETGPFLCLRFRAMGISFDMPDTVGVYISITYSSRNHNIQYIDLQLKYDRKEAIRSSRPSVKISAPAGVTITALSADDTPVR